MALSHAMGINIKSIISIPIRHNMDKYKVLGVLSIDSTEQLKHTPFKNGGFQKKLEEISKMCYGTIII